MTNLLFTIMCLFSSLVLSYGLDLKGKTKIIKETVVLKDYSYIRGPGTIKVKSSSAGFFFNGSNIVIENVTFIVEDNLKKNNSLLHLLEGSSNIIIRGNNFKGARYSILKADRNTKRDKELLFKKRAKDILFQNNNCEGQYSRHLHLSSLENIKITGNTFKNSVRDSIRIRQNIKNVLINDNSFKNIGLKSNESSDAIDTYWSGEELIISNNHFSEIATHGLDLKGISPDKDSGTSRLIVSNNIFDNIQYSGILISSGQYIAGKINEVRNFIINSNQFYNINLNNKNENDSAIFLRHGVKGVIISSNIIEAKRSHGIVVANFESKVQQTSNVVIASNIIDAKGTPVYIHAARNIQVSGNNFFGKKVRVIKKYKSFKGEGIELGNNL